jgi:hypothetical protein
VSLLGIWVESLSATLDLVAPECGHRRGEVVEYLTSRMATLGAPWAASMISSNAALTKSSHVGA